MKLATTTRVVAVMIAAFALAISCVGSAKAGILYSQPWDGGGDLYASQNDTTGGNGNFATVYDNFTVSSGGTVTNVGWVGGYFNPAVQGPITQFTLTFWKDNAGQPGSALATETISGNANETFLSNASGFPTYSYDTNLPTGFAASAGTQYWLSIVPDLGFPPQWGWAGGTGGDSVSYQDFFGSRSQLGVDMAFTLSGSNEGPTPTPEPASLTLLGFGAVSLLGYAGFRRRKAKAAHA